LIERADRSLFGRWARPFAPTEFGTSLRDVDLEVVVARGKRLVLLDVDNTLVPWGSEALPEWVLEWLAQGRSLGLEFCILSNTRHPARLARLAERMGIPYLRGKFKPNPDVYRRALAQFGVEAKQAIMIGDQLFTDVLGANRAGIESVWLVPMARREFIGTKVSRMGERILARHFKKRLRRKPGGPSSQ
jgi:HAD superfamily phosphatase (TIGR01668 family)